MLDESALERLNAALERYRQRSPPQLSRRSSLSFDNESECSAGTKITGIQGVYGRFSKFVQLAWFLVWDIICINPVVSFCVLLLLIVSAKNVVWDTFHVIYAQIIWHDIWKNRDNYKGAYSIFGSALSNFRPQSD